MRTLGVLLIPGCRPAGLEILRELVARANDYGQSLYGEVEPVRTAAVQTLSFDGHPVATADGRRIAVDAALADARIAGLYIADFRLEPEAWPQRLRDMTDDLAVLGRVGRAAGVTACAGAGVIVAVEAGLTTTGPVSVARRLVGPLRRRRRIAIDPTTPVVEAPGLLSTSGLAGEPRLGLRLIEKAITPHLARVVGQEIGAPLPPSSIGDDRFAVTSLRPDDLVDRACDLMRADFSRPMDLKAFAFGLGVSPRTLARRFQSSIGMGPKAYQQHLRLASAQSMLARTTRPVAKIAAMVGYGDPAYFIALFRGRVGETPAAFRTRTRRSSHP